MQFHRCKTTTLPLLHPIKCFSRKRTLTIVLLYWQEEDTFRRSLGADRFILPMTSLAAKNHFLCSANRPDRFGPIMNTNQVCTWVDLKLYENKTWLLYAFVLLERRSDFALGCCLYVYLHHGSLNRTCTRKIFPKPITSPTRVYIPTIFFDCSCFKPSETVIDHMTLSWFEDTGWYGVNYSHAEPFLWGSGAWTQHARLHTLEDLVHQGHYGLVCCRSRLWLGFAIVLSVCSIFRLFLFSSVSETLAMS